MFRQLTCESKSPHEYIQASKDIKVVEVVRSLNEPIRLLKMGNSLPKTFDTLAERQILFEPGDGAMRIKILDCKQVT